MSVKDDVRAATETPTTRRGFLRGVLLAGGATAAAPALSAAVQDPEETAADSASEARGYRLTRHIQDYYRTADL